MKAIVFNKKTYLGNKFPCPKPKQGESLIKVKLAGICRTDIEITKGYMGFNGIPGHEFTGVVEESKDSKLVDKRVVGEINCYCGKCVFCKSGLKNHCPNRSVLGILNKDGAFAEYLTLPNKNIHLIPDNVTDEQAVFTEPLAAAFRILEQIKPKKDDRIVVLGDGKLGLLIAQALSLKVRKLMLVGKHEKKLSIAGRKNIDTSILKDFKERDVDVVVECTGSPDGFNMAADIVKPCGTIILKSTYAPSQTINPSLVVIKEINIIGSRCGPFKPALDALKKGLIDTSSLIEKTFSLGKGVEAIKHAKKKGMLKVLLRCA